MNITKYVKDWFARGDDDLVLVRLILEKEIGSLNLACFHAQQAAEKYLKGFLACCDLHVRKIHNLEILLGDCENIDSSFAELRDSAAFLNQFYIESRYPDDYIEFPREDAEKALESALRIKEFVVTKIKPQEKRGGFSVIGITLVIAVIVLIGGGFFGYQYLKLQKIREGTKPPAAKTEAPPSSTETQPQTEEIDTSTWKTYRNEKYGFEVRYPSTWWAFKSQRTPGGDHFYYKIIEVSQDQNVVFSSIDLSEPDKRIMIEKSIWFLITRENGEYFIRDSHTVEDFWNKLGKQDRGAIVNRLISKKVIYGVDFVIFEQNNWDVETQMKVWTPQALFMYEGEFFWVRGSAKMSSALFYQIISTFKFIR